MSKPLTYSFRGDVGTNKKRLLLYSADHKPGTGPEKVIELIKFNDSDGYLGEVPEDISIAGVLYKKGDLIHYAYEPIRDDRVYKVSTITSPKDYSRGEVEYKFAYGKWLGRYITGNHSYKWYLLAEGSTGYDSKGNWNILKNGKWVANKEASSSSSTSSSSTTGTTTNSTDATSSTSSTSSTTGTSSTTSTDSSTTRSFDFIDDILGTKSTDAEKDNTDYDPNEIANTTVSNSSLSKIKRDTVNELVLAYSKAMLGILDNYGKKDMYSLYSRDSI